MGDWGNNFLSGVRYLFLLSVVLLFGFCGICNGVTIATFADTVTLPMFSVSYSNGVGTITGIWDDSKAGLTLEVVYSGVTYEDVFIVMEELSYNTYTEMTDSGTIKFFEDEHSTSERPLIQIDFNRAYVTPRGFSAMDLFYDDGVVISGYGIGDVELENETFLFGFANHVMTDSGFTATCLFTSSADVVPEPATLVLVSMGLVLIRGRKK